MKSWPFPRLVAHRGGGTLAPENTLASIRLGQSLGYRAHEFDVKLTRDDVAILLHDPTLERTTAARGRAKDLPWEALKAVDAGSWHSPEFRGEPIPAFEEAAKLLRSKGTLANIEIKPTPGFDASEGRRIALETRRLWSGARTLPLFSSFSFEALMAAKDATPEIPRGWLVKEFTDADWDRLAALEAVSLHTDHRTFPLERLADVHGRGYRVMLYTVNEIAAAERLLDAGIDGLFTDNLREFAARFPGFL